MLILIIGNRGSGKTLLSTIIAKDSDRQVYANYDIKLDDGRFKPLEIIDFLELPDNIDVIIDEGYTWLEARTSGYFLNRYLSYIVLQSRKRTIDIIVTAQMFSTVDVRFRNQAEVIVKCERVGLDFVYDFLRLDNFKSNRFVLPYEKAKRYFNLYDTYQIVEPHTKIALEMKLLESDPKRLYEKIKKIGDSILTDFKDLDAKEITHDRVKASLMRNGHNMSLEPLIYVFIKDSYGLKIEKKNNNLENSNLDLLSWLK